MNRQSIKVGLLEINYLVDGAEKGGLGVFELCVPAGGPPARALAMDLDTRGFKPADHGKMLGVTGTADALDGIGWQREAAALQEFLQPGLGVAQVIPGVEGRKAGAQDFQHDLARGGPTAIEEHGAEDRLE